MANKLIPNLGSGGMNTRAAPLVLRDNECELIRNYNIDTVGSLTKRTGYDVFATQPVAARRVHGLFQYTNTATPAETTQVMVVNNAGNTQAVIYYNNAGTWATSKTDDTAVATFTNFNRARFFTFLNYLFRVNGVQVVASSIDVNGSVWGTTNAPATITPTFGTVFQDRVYLGRNGTTNGSRVYFSKLPSGGTITWDTVTDFFDVNPDDGDELTGFENNGNRLLLFKNRSLYRWVFGQTEPDRLFGVGTESQECVKTNLDLGITFFVNQQGVYAYSGGRPKLISRKIQDWIDAVPAADFNDMAAETDNDHYYVYLSDSITVNSVAYTNVMAVYTISLDAWTIYTLNTPVRVMSKLILSGAENIYFGSSNGRTYQFDSGTADDSGGADGNTAVVIPTEVITKEYLLSYPEKTKVEFVHTAANVGVTTQAAYRMNRRGDYEPLGTLPNRFNSSRHIGVEGNSIQLRFSDSGLPTSRIELINIEHQPSAKSH